MFRAVAALLVLMLPQMGAPMSARAETSCQMIAVANADGTGQTTLNSTGNNDAPRWSSDSKRIVFTSSRAGGSDVYLRELSSGSEKRLTSTQDSSFPDISPSGDEIVYSHNFGKLSIMRSNGKLIRDLPGLPNIFFTQPRFSPDGNTIAAYGETVNGGPRLVYLLPANGGKAPVALPAQDGEKNWQPAWKSVDELTYVSMRSDGTYAVLYNLVSGKTVVGAKINGLGSLEWAPNGDQLYSMIDTPSTTPVIRHRLTDGTDRPFSLGSAPAYSNDGKVAFITNGCGKQQAWICVPLFSPIDVVDVKVEGTEDITFTTTLAQAANSMAHSNTENGNLDSRDPALWSNPIAGDHSSRWHVSDRTKEWIGLDVSVTRQGWPDQKETISCGRVQHHMTVYTGANLVHITGLNLDETVPVVNGIAARNWLPAGAYQVTPIVNGTEVVANRTVVLMILKDLTVSLDSSGGHGGTAKAAFTRFIPMVVMKP